MSTAKRIAWVDIAKGLAMLAVIVGHTELVPSVLRALPISFHIPLFFFLSGYTAHVRSQRELMHKGMQLLLPLWMCLAFLMLAVNFGFNSGGGFCYSSVLDAGKGPWTNTR